MTLLERNCSPNSTSDGDTIIYVSKREMNGRELSRLAKDFLNPQ
jgi:hypothetical protein